MEKWEEPEQVIEPMVELLKEEIVTRNFTQMILGPTRYWKDKTPSLIDQCWVNDPGRVSNIKNTVRGTADHNMISICYRMAGKVSSPHETISRDWNKLEESELVRRISLVNWDSVFGTNDLDVANYEFQMKFLEVLDNLAPMRWTQARSKRSRWISEETKRKMTERDAVRCSAVASSRAEEWDRYRDLRNQVNKDVKNDRKEHLENIYKELENKNDAKGLFRMAKNMTGWKTGGAPEGFLLNGRMVRNPREMAETQMTSFREKVKDIIEKLPDAIGDPLETLKLALQRWEGTNRIVELAFQPVGRDTVVKLLKNLGNGHAYGHDGLDGH